MTITLNNFYSKDKENKLKSHLCKYGEGFLLNTITIDFGCIIVLVVVFVVVVVAAAVAAAGILL
jgi:hypothetical protein